MAANLVPLSEIADIIGGYAFKSADFGASGLPVVKIASIEPPKVNLQDCEKIPAEKVVGLDKFRLQDRDIVMAMTGATIGKVGRFRSSQPAYLNQRVAKISAKAGREFDDFIFSLVSQAGFDKEVLNHSNGSAQANVSTDGIGRILVPDFSPAEQYHIGKVIGALDDKIELNRRMNATLETMARMLFNKHFPTFIAPENNSLILPFTETVEILGGGTPKTTVTEFWHGNIPWFSVADAPDDSSVFVIDTEKKITPAGVENSSTQVLPVGTTIITARGTVGKVALVGVPMAMNQSCYGLRGLLGEKGYYNYFATRFLVATLQQRAHGSVFDTITRDTLAGVQVVAPPKAVVNEFENTIDPMMARIRNNLFESRNLASLRDTLLPKLLSGELEPPKEFDPFDL